MSDVLRIAGDDEAASAGDAHSDDVSIDDALASAACRFEDRTDLTGEVEVGVDQAQGRPFPAGPVVASHRGFQSSCAGTAASDLRAHECRGDDLSSTPVGLGQQGPKGVRGSGCRESIEPDGVED